MPSAATRVAVLVAQHPAINHAVILNEIRQLRRWLDISTASIRDPDRPTEKLTEEERDEAARTFYVKRQGVAGAAKALLLTLLSRPIRVLRAFAYSVTLRDGSKVSALKRIAYLSQAL